MGGRKEGRKEGRNNWMRGSRVRKQRSKRNEKREETDSGRGEEQGGKENKPSIIYLEGTSSPTLSSGQWC